MKLGIANLLLTIFVTVYFGFRNENLQKDLIYLQEDLSQEASTANLEIYTTCWNVTGCDGAVRIVNLGKSTAQNVQVVVVVDNVSQEWSQSINDISNFSVDVLPPSLISTIKNVKKSISYSSDSLDGNNAYEINISVLPPDSYIDVILQTQYNDEMESYSEKRAAIVYADGISMDISDELGNFINQEYVIASFTASALCDNCKQVVSANFIVSMLDASSMNVISQTSKQTEVEFYLHFILPKDVVHVPDNSIFYLDVLQEEGKKVQLHRLQESKK